MGVKEIIQKFGSKGTERKEVLRQMEQNDRLSRIVEERRLSSNERELDRYMNEDREAMIKEQLEFARKKRQDDIDFNHNPLDAKNITAGTQWEVLKEKNQFASRSNMFSNSESVLKNNNKLLKTNKKLLKSNDKIMKGGNMFKI